MYVSHKGLINSTNVITSGTHLLAHYYSHIIILYPYIYPPSTDRTAPRPSQAFRSRVAILLKAQALWMLCQKMSSPDWSLGVRVPGAGDNGGAMQRVWMGARQAPEQDGQGGSCKPGICLIWRYRRNLEDTSTRVVTLACVGVPC